jgi:hypothetical protein
MAPSRGVLDRWGRWGEGIGNQEVPMERNKNESAQKGQKQEEMEEQSAYVPDDMIPEDRDLDEQQEQSHPGRRAGDRRETERAGKQGSKTK